ncbi:hypothetical protein BC628DRAFT_794954 [Trametes gibbosa]|nr:hypothetical protein BC628DRAFT_794954 [Trametes gibbosa]
MFSMKSSKKNTRATAAAGASAAGPSTNQTPQPPAPSAPSPMRTRSGKILTPIAEGVKTVRAKLAAGRRGKKAPAEAPAGAEASTTAQAVAATSTVANTKPAPASRKAAPKRRAATARGQTKKGKGFAPAPPPATPPPVPSPAPVAGPSTAITTIAAPAPVVLPSLVPASDDDAPVLPEVPEHRRLKRQGAYYFDNEGRALPEGEYPDENGNAPISALLKEVQNDKCLEDAMSARSLRPGGSIYGLPEFASKLSFVYQPFQFRLPDLEPVVFPSIPAQPLPAAFPSASAEPLPDASDSRQATPQLEEELVEAPSIGTRLSRQYAAIFDQDGFPLPRGTEGAGELAPIGEAVANILKAGRAPPYPPTWRGSLFEPENALPSLPVSPEAVALPAASESAALPLDEPVVATSDPQSPRPTRSLPRLRRHHAVLINLDGDDAPTRPPAPTLTRQNAVYLDKDGFALPTGVSTTREAQFPEEFASAKASASASGSPGQAPAVIMAAEKMSEKGPVLRGLRSLFARRSKSQLAVYNGASSAGLTEETSATAGAGEEPSQVQEEEPTVAPLADVKGKKRAREPEDINGDAEDVPRVQRTRTVSVRSFTTRCSLLKATVTVLPIPAGIRCRDKMVLFQEGKTPTIAFTAMGTAHKRSREEFEDGASAYNADEPAAKKARV